MTTWSNSIAEILLDESKHCQLAIIPLALGFSVEYAPDWVYLLAPYSDTGWR